MRVLVLALFVVGALGSNAQDTTTVTHHGTIKLRKAYNEVDHWPRIAKKMEGNITAKELCYPQGIYTVYPYQITGFTMKCSYLKDEKGLSSGNARLTDEMCKVVSVLPSGAIVHFEDIMALDDKGREKRLNSLRFIIAKD